MAKLKALPSDTTTYQDMTEALLPRGPIWRSGAVRGLVNGLAPEAVRFHNRLVDLMLEAYPSTATELLAEWEVEFGLPLCTDAPTTTADRQAALAGRVAAKGGQDVHYYRALIRAVLGDPAAVVTIIEWPYGRPFYAWLGSAWDLLGAPGAAHVWRVILPSGTSPELAHIVECLLDRFKPAHTRLELVSDVSAYYESLVGGDESYLEASTPIAARLALPGTGDMGEFTLLVWVTWVGAGTNGRSLCLIGESASDSIVSFAEGRDTQTVDVCASGDYAATSFVSPPSVAQQFLFALRSNGATLVTNAGSSTASSDVAGEPFDTPQDALRLLYGLDDPAQIRNIGMAGRRLTDDEIAALRTAGHRHDYRARYETDDGEVWAGEVLPFMWCTTARPAWPYWRLEPGGAELSSSGYTNLPYLESNFLFWFRVLNDGNGLLVYEPNLIADNTINVIDNDGMTFRLEWDSFGGATTLFGPPLAVGQWCALAFIDGYGPYDDFALLLNGAVNLTASGTGLTRLGGNPVFGGEDLLVDIRAPIYVARKFTPGPPSQGYRPAEISAHYQLGPEHDPRIPSGAWTAQDIVIAWADVDVGGEIANSGSGGTHPLVLSGDIETLGANARVINSGSAGECDLTFYGDVTSEED